MSCHGPELKGNGSSYPSLINLEKKHTDKTLTNIIENGRNMMPAFKQISNPEKETLLAFLLNKEDKEPTGNSTKTKEEPIKKSILDEVPYAMTGYNRFLDKDRYPGIKPPWGTLNAVDLNNGKLLWKVPLGEFEELTKQGMPITGTENYGGPLVTKGGLVFIAATKDGKIRAFDKKTGKQVWEHDSGRWLRNTGYLFFKWKAICSYCLWWRKDGSKSGDTYMAFALPATK